MRVRSIAAATLLSAASSVQAGPPAEKPAGLMKLAAPKDFPSAITAVESATGAKGGPIEIASGALPLEEGRSFAVESSIAERLLAGSHTAFRKAGFYLFRYERSFGLAGEKDRIGLIASSDRSAVLRRIGTAGPHHGHTTERIVAWLNDLAIEEPFELTEIGVDYVAGRFERSPKDPAALARRSVAFAPDLVAGRASTLDLLVEEIRVNRTLYLIW